MPKRTAPVRRHTRFPVRWPIFYSGDDFLAKGVVLDLTTMGCRVAGPMPVEPGMRLRLCLSPPDKDGPVWIEEATVLWVRGQVFAVEMKQAATEDQGWIAQYLEQALGLWLIPPPNPGLARRPGHTARQERPNLQRAAPWGNHRNCAT